MRHTDEFRFCCLARHVANCYPEPDEFSSCEDLMSNSVLRICVWVLSIISLAGNVLVIVWRIFYKTNNRVHTFLIINLAIGDFCMGLYLLIIAAVDVYYRGEYFIHDATWRASTLCQLAGFFSTFSSELSVFTLTVITIHRLAVITFPFRVSRLNMSWSRAIMALVWLTVGLLAGLPLADISYFRNFYGRSGVCLALHITHEKPSGWEYAVFVFLGVKIPPQVFAWVAVFILPLNAAVNPLLYTLATAPFLGRMRDRVLNVQHSFKSSIMRRNTCTSYGGGDLREAVQMKHYGGGQHQ
ncbi:unnamed protein product, partial [Meganyctiphanes norvegica]